MPLNGVLLQCFQWYLPADGALWRRVSARAADFAASGFTALWLPPACKGASGDRSTGYDTYDLFDLGEFDQKGTIRTKYGTRKEYQQAIRDIQAAGMHVYADVVFNHKSGADETERVMVQEVDWNDRNRAVSDWYEISAYTKFTFPGRQERYSPFKWNWLCFDALDYNADTHDSSKLYHLKDKYFATDVSHEHGNADYLFANDIDTQNQFVANELTAWGEWLLETFGVNGFRIDAAKHIHAAFFPKWLDHLRRSFEKELFSVGEYWSGDLNELLGYLNETGRCMSLFDVPLHYNFYYASHARGDFDLRNLVSGTLVQTDPMHAVTFVDNHDTQPTQSLESPVADWFRPIAYSVILLREGGYPCVFLGDYDGGGDNPDAQLACHREVIDKLMALRHRYAYGPQIDYFDHWDCVGWTRLGNNGLDKAMAVLLTDGQGEGTKWMNVARPGATFMDAMGGYTTPVVANADGWAEFRCRPGSVNVWVQE